MEERKGGREAGKDKFIPTMKATAVATKLG